MVKFNMYLNLAYRKLAPPQGFYGVLRRGTFSVTRGGAMFFFYGDRKKNFACGAHRKKKNSPAARSVKQNLLGCNSIKKNFACGALRKNSVKHRKTVLRYFYGEALSP